LLLTLLATLAAALVAVLFVDLGLLPAVGVGQAVGMGAIATMAARRVAEPQADRLGLRGFELRSLIAVLCLAPLILLASEVDNIAARLVVQDADTSATRPDATSGGDESGADAGDAAGAAAAHGAEAVLAPLIDPEDPWSLLQAMIVLVGISPVVEEFFFRGVLQQGLVARLGLVRGIAMVALLWALVRPAPVDHWLRFLAVSLASIVLGSALGLVRVATGSILAAILLSSLWAAIGLGSLALQGRVELPGLNVEQSHLPWPLTFVSLLAVGWAGLTLYRVARLRFRIECRAFGLEDPGAP
jgi:membrane protease YdiL (CAAX protease family)